MRQKGRAARTAGKAGNQGGKQFHPLILNAVSSSGSFWRGWVPDRMTHTHPVHPTLPLKPTGCYCPRSLSQAACYEAELSRSSMPGGDTDPAAHGDLELRRSAVPRSRGNQEPRPRVESIQIRRLV